MRPDQVKIAGQYLSLDEDARLMEIVSQAEDDWYKLTGRCIWVGADGTVYGWEGDCPNYDPEFLAYLRELAAAQAPTGGAP